LFATYTPNEELVNRAFNFLSLQSVCGLILVFAFGTGLTRGQEAPSPPAKQVAKSPTASDKEPELPAQIELETHVRFEADGDSRKEVHTRVHINNELGVRQFARLTFDYDRSFQQIEFPLVRITHEGGGTVDILPSAITDQPNPAVVDAPDYQDVRVKSVRILGLAPGDILEYRVVTTRSHHPLAPDFWVDHTFDRSGLVSREHFELDLPASRSVQVRVNAETPAKSSKESDKNDSEPTHYEWDLSSEGWAKHRSRLSGSETEPDIVITTFSSWSQLSTRLYKRLNTGFTTAIWEDSMRRTGFPREPVPERSLYNLASTKVATLDLPLDFERSFRDAAAVLSSGYGSPEEKSELLLVLLFQESLRKNPPLVGLALVSNAKSPENQLPRPSLFTELLVSVRDREKTVYLDPGAEVAPFGVVRSDVRGRKVLVLGNWTKGDDAKCWTTVPQELPFPSFQRVSVDSVLSAEGTLTSRVHYNMRGDNELLLRVAFHQAPKEKWKEVAQILALSDGFRGKITNVTASDPYATKEPFTVEYEIVQPKFVDWAKKPVRIPALLPQLGLPDSSAKPAPGTGTPAIDLGTPLDVETRLTLHLPAGTSARTPTGTSVERDYATFASKYAASRATVTATRHLNFLLREVQGDRAADYNAFVRAVQGDEAQEFTLERGEAASQQTKPENSAKKD
jgi:hypothetical protein